MYESIEDLKKDALEMRLPLHEVIIQREMEFTETLNRQIVFDKLKKSLDVMKQSLKNGMEHHIELPIEDAQEQSEKMQAPPIFLSKDMKEAVYWAMSLVEYNSGMGLICAAPTAGSSGVFPATILKAKEMLDKSEEDLMNAFIVGAGIGVIIGNRASLSGSEAGCQAEVGVAAAMAAAAITYMSGGSIDQVEESVALALKNLLGLVCDPVAGLVISPCIKRNAIGVMNAFLASEMALSGVTSIIPADEVIDAMMKVGRKLPYELKETGLGGIAKSPTGQRIKNKLTEENRW